MRKHLPLGLIISVFLFWTVGTAAADEVYHSDEKWAVHPVAGWEFFASGIGHSSFVDPSGRAVLQVLTSGPGSYDSSAAMADATISNLSATGEKSEFTWHSPGFLAGQPGGFSVDAVLAELSWKSQNFSTRGWAAFFAGGPERNSYIVLSFVLDSAYNDFLPVLFSNIDSFQPFMEATSDYVGAPGPLSQFIASSEVTALSDPASQAASQYRQELENRAAASETLIEREAIILSAYANAPDPVKFDAWRRFYQLIYRDSFADMGPTARSLIASIQPRDQSDLAQRVLAQLQGYEYRRTGGISDLDAPQRVILDAAGDCDSLVLAYLQILSHSGIDGIIMINPSQSHSVAGLGSGVRADDPRANARFPGLGSEWLVAELTQEVGIGLISRDMADPAEWMGFDLNFSVD